MLETKLSDCTGCGVCVLSCPHNCISMEKNSLGFLQPKVDTTSCVSCNLCNLKCHTNQKLNPFSSHTALAVWGKDKSIRANGSSGGVFYSIGSAFVDCGGIVAAAVMDKDFNLRHKIATTRDGLIPMQKSKYFQSDTLAVYQDILFLLKDNKRILFIGTPCQVGALLKYIPEKLQKKLYTIDILCHGVPSNKMFLSHIRSLEKKSGKKIESVLFRSKDNPEGWRDSCRLVVQYNDNTKEDYSSRDDLYWRAFLANLSLRDSCYDCIYSGKERVGDITIGDYWGIGRKYSVEFDPHEGVSVAFLNSNKGKEMFDMSEIEYYERVSDEAIENNFSLKGPAEKSAGYERFRKYYPRYEFDKAVILSTWGDILGDKVKNFLGDQFTSCIREIKHSILKGE